MLQVRFTYAFSTYRITKELAFNSHYRTMPRPQPIGLPHRSRELQDATSTLKNIAIQDTFRSQGDSKISKEESLPPEKNTKELAKFFETAPQARDEPMASEHRGLIPGSLHSVGGRGRGLQCPQPLRLISSHIAVLDMKASIERNSNTPEMSSKMSTEAARSQSNHSRHDWEGQQRSLANTPHTKAISYSYSASERHNAPSYIENRLWHPYRRTSYYRQQPSRCKMNDGQRLRRRNCSGPTNFSRASQQNQERRIVSSPVRQPKVEDTAQASSVYHTDDELEQLHGAASRMQSPCTRQLNESNDIGSYVTESSQTHYTNWKPWLWLMPILRKNGPKESSESNKRTLEDENTLEKLNKPDLKTPQSALEESFPTRHCGLSEVRHNSSPDEPS